MKSVLPSLLSISLFLAITGTIRAQKTVTVNRIKSGTVFLTSSGQTITLLGVGMPTSQGITLEDARNYLEMALSSGEVTLVADSLVRDPATGPKPRYVYLPDGMLVNRKMIIDGYGTAARVPAHSMLEEFIAAQEVAKEILSGSDISQENIELEDNVLEDNVLDDTDQENKSQGNFLENILQETVSTLLNGNSENDEAEKPGERKTSKRKTTKGKNSKQEISQRKASEPRSGRQEASSEGTERSTTVRCTGTTTKGVQCKKMTKNSNGRCPHHQ